LTSDFEGCLNDFVYYYTVRQDTLTFDLYLNIDLKQQNIWNKP